jgi:hypothetical protein
MASSYTLVTHDRGGREHTRPYTSRDPLAPGSLVLLDGRYWLVERVENGTVRARPARYRLTLRHPDGREEAAAFRRYRKDAPTVGHELATNEDGVAVSWVVVEQRLARDDAGEPFLESIAVRDNAEVESLPDHQLEHALDRGGDGAVAAAAALARAREENMSVELVALEAGAAPDWRAASSYLESMILEELEDDLVEQCGVDPRHEPRERWLELVKRRLRDDLESFRDDTEGPRAAIEQWEFEGSTIFAAAGRFDDDENPLSAYGWMCRLVDAGVLQAAGFYRARKPLLPL